MAQDSAAAVAWLHRTRCGAAWGGDRLVGQMGGAMAARYLCWLVISWLMMIVDYTPQSIGDCNILYPIEGFL